MYVKVKLNIKVDEFKQIKKNSDKDNDSFLFYCKHE